ncbi:MAG: glutamate ABC transporter substrate-binding protein [Verrucomicrobia bacterium]|nr:glutamate ABC transporter substrate-binding protein [Verrucomicrobiota bacterium]
MIKPHSSLAAALTALCLAASAAFAQTPTPAPSASSTPSVENKDVIPEIKTRGKLIVGCKYDVRLFGLNNPMTHRVEGFDADLGRAMAKALLGDEKKIELVETVSANRIPFLTENKVDIVISTMTITEDRKKQIDMSDVYYMAGQSLLVPKGSPIHSVKDLDGKIVTTVQGSTSEKNIQAAAPNAKFNLLKSYSECFTALGNKQADAMTTDDIILLGFKATAPDKYELVGGQFTQEPYGIGVRKGHEDLLKFVNDELAKMKADGRWKALYDKHLKPVSGQSIEPPQ